MVALRTGGIALFGRGQASPLLPLVGVRFLSGERAMSACRADCQSAHTISTPERANSPLSQLSRGNVGRAGQLDQASRLARPTIPSKKFITLLLSATNPFDAAGARLSEPAPASCFSSHGTTSHSSSIARQLRSYFLGAPSLTAFIPGYIIRFVWDCAGGWRNRLIEEGAPHEFDLHR